MSAPTTRKPESNGSSLVPKFPATPVTRTVRSVDMTTVEALGVVAAVLLALAEEELLRPALGASAGED